MIAFFLFSIFSIYNKLINLAISIATIRQPFAVQPPFHLSIVSRIIKWKTKQWLYTQIGYNRTKLILTKQIQKRIEKKYCRIPKRTNDTCTHTHAQICASIPIDDDDDDQNRRCQMARHAEERHTMTSWRINEWINQMNRNRAANREQNLENQPNILSFKVFQAQTI